MTYRVLYVREDGYQFANDFHNKVAKDNFVEVLSRSGIQYGVSIIEDKKYQICKVVFDLTDNREYTFADPDRHVKTGDIAEVRCVDGHIKNALVKSTSFMTIDEIKAFCNSIGYKKLGRVQKLVWRSAN